MRRHNSKRSCNTWARRTKTLLTHHVCLLAPANAPAPSTSHSYIHTISASSAVHTSAVILRNLFVC